MMRIGSVVVDCNDFDLMFEFWRDALRYVPRDPPEEGWVVLCDPEKKNVSVSLQRVPEKRLGKNRLHFDLDTDDQDGEIERLVALGATRHQYTPEPDADSVILGDPEGNLFCVVDKADRALTETF